MSALDDRALGIRSLGLGKSFAISPSSRRFRAPTGLKRAPPTSRQKRLLPLAVLSRMTLARRYWISPRVTPPIVVLTRSLMDGGSLSMFISHRKLPVNANADDSQKLNPLVRPALKKRLPW